MSLKEESRILIVDDAKDTQLLLEFDLSAAGYQVRCCDSGQAAIDELEDLDVDLILLDMYMPGLSGLETLKQLKAQEKTSMIPVIMLSASTDEDEVVAALELGAGDYVSKPYVAKVLLARMRTAIRLKEKTDQLEHLAKTDFLTGINNRGSFYELTNNAISLANRVGHPIVIAMLDIDLFKQVNDNYGHDAGDQVLRSFSQAMKEVFRDYDIIGRVGGEEFAVCLPNTSNEAANSACERFRLYIEQLNVEVTTDEQQSKEINVTVSVGLVSATTNVISIEDLLKRADSALYYAKEHGRNQVIDIDCINKLEGDVLCDEGIDHTVLSEPNMTNDVPFDGIDFTVGVNNVLGDKELFNEILVMFYQDHHLDGEKLHIAIRDNDINAAKHIAHTLKGVACSVGAMALFEVTKSLDTAINMNQQNTFEELFSLLEPELKKVMKGIALKLDVA